MNYCSNNAIDLWNRKRHLSECRFIFLLMKKLTCSSITDTNKNKLNELKLFMRRRRQKQHQMNRSHQCATRKVEERMRKETLKSCQTVSDL